MAPPTASDLIFSEQANHKFSKTLNALKQHTLSIQNRLNSIVIDSRFVQAAAKAYKRPLVSNERCGSWYIDPQYKDGSAYFKSTDGHSNAWKFSRRRLNTHLLKIIGENDGCIIVDSTRRGKRMPDALSKTIPIWCCVLNRALFPQQFEHHDLFTPPKTVSASEHTQIELLLDSFVQSFLELEIDLRTLRCLIKKPLRPMWVTPESHILPLPAEEIFEDYHPIICCTASRRVLGTESSEGGYIQGSGDDTENWAFGLTPNVFWANSELLLSTPESDLPQLIEQLVARSTPVALESNNLAPVSPTLSLFIVPFASHATQWPEKQSIFISLCTAITDPSTWQISPSQLNVGIGQHKIGSRNLRTALPFIISFVLKKLNVLELEGQSTDPKLIVACSTGKDHSVGVALALLCLLYDDQGNLIRVADQNIGTIIDKLFIKRRLGWIMTTMPHVNPSRATLQSVNSYLIDRPT